MFGIHVGFCVRCVEYMLGFLLRCLEYILDLLFEMVGIHFVFFVYVGGRDFGIHVLLLF